MKHQRIWVLPTQFQKLSKNSKVELGHNLEKSIEKSSTQKIYPFLFPEFNLVITINIIECYRELNFSRMIRWFAAILNSISNLAERFTCLCCPRSKCRQRPDRQTPPQIPLLADTTSDIGRVISIFHF